MPRQAKPVDRSLPSQTLIIDNGGWTIKAGFARPEPQIDDCQVIPNCIARDQDKKIWVGGQLDQCKDFGSMGFRRPVEKGFIVNWEAEKAIWDGLFINDDSKLKCVPQDTNLIFTEAPNTPTALQTNCDQIVFEEYEFASYSRCVGSSLNAYHNIPRLFDKFAPVTKGDNSPAQCLLVIDSGFSHTTVTPLFNGRPVQQAVRRLDIGGKFLTNYLNELVSIRHYDMSDETYTVNQVKEAISFVSEDFRRDLEATWKGTTNSRKRILTGDREVAIDYVLPDYNSHKPGYVRPHVQSSAERKGKGGPIAGVDEDGAHYMPLGNERFKPPELFFHPEDVGMVTPGLPETIMQSLSGLPTGLWPAMLANILVVGGNSKITGFMTRLETELRQLAPVECTLRIARAPDPIKSTWLGGACLANNTAALKTSQVTRQEYQEHGSGWLSKIFAGTSSR